MVELMTKKEKGGCMRFDLTHVRHDPAHCLIPGLFRSLKRGERKKEKLDITYQHGDEMLKFWGPEPLGADDLRVLQGLVGLAAIEGPGGNGLMLFPTTTSAAGRALREGAKLQWDAVAEDMMVVRCSFHDLAREIGYSEIGGSQFKTIRKCIERMFAVTIFAEQGGKRRGFQLLSRYASDEGSEEFYIALNPMIARAITSSKGNGQHVRIEMSEVRTLQGSAARLIHQRLCAWVDPGKTRQVTLETLCSYVWPNEADNANTIKTRRREVRLAIKEFAGLGWSITEYARGKFEVIRPKKGMA